MSALDPAPRAPSLLARLWPTDTTRAERSSLIAGGLGWMLDAMDVMLYSLVLAYLIREFSMSTRTAGLLNSLTLIASAIGGLIFGVVADRIGRTRSLMASILLYSLSSAACGLAHSIPQLAIFRFLLGLGMGGEWSAAAALIAETWRPATPRQSSRTHAVFLRHRRSHRRRRRPVRPSALRLARRFLRRRSSRSDGPLDSPRCPRARKLEAPRSIGLRPRRENQSSAFYLQKLCDSAQSPPP